MERVLRVCRKIHRKLSNLDSCVDIIELSNIVKEIANRENFYSSVYGSRVVEPEKDEASVVVVLMTDQSGWVAAMTYTEPHVGTLLRLCKKFVIRKLILQKALVRVRFHEWNDVTEKLGY